MPATQLHVTRWVDPIVEAKGYDARSGYVEIFWLPVLGPTATILLWRFQLELAVDLGGWPMDLTDLSRELGLGTTESKHAPLPRAISRLVHFGLAKRMAPGQLVVRCVVQLLSAQQLSGLSAPLQLAHRGFLSREKAGDRGLPASGPWPTINRIDDSDTQ
jgi:hypothetical protein